MGWAAKPQVVVDMESDDQTRMPTVLIILSANQVPLKTVDILNKLKPLNVVERILITAEVVRVYPIPGVGSSRFLTLVMDRLDQFLDVVRVVTKP